MDIKQDYEFYAKPVNSPYEITKEQFEENKEKLNENTKKFLELMQTMEENKCENIIDEEPSVFAVPCDKAFVVDKEKAEEFKLLKPNTEILKKIEENVKKLNIKIELEPIDYSGPVLRKTKK